MKIFRNNNLIYESPDEFVIADDSNSMIYNKNLFDALIDLVPENFRNFNKYFNELSRLSAYIATSTITKSDNLNYIYNTDSASEEILNFLSNRYNIIFPVNYDLDKRRFILKYFPNFIKIKGTEFATKILDFIGRDESDFYNSIPGNYRLYEYSEGFIRVYIEDESDRIRIGEYLKFAQTLINRITPAGMYIKICNYTSDELLNIGDFYETDKNPQYIEDSILVNSENVLIQQENS